MAGQLTIDTLKAGSGVLATQNGMTGIAKAWVRWNASGTIAKAFNVSSITVRGTGQWTVNFTTALDDSNYSMVGSAGYGVPYTNTGGIFVSYNWDGTNGVAPTTSSCQINTVQGTRNGVDAPYFNSAITSVAFFD